MEVLSRASIILFRGGDSRTSIILFRAALLRSRRPPPLRVAGVKESEIRSPSGLSSVNSLPTYFQLTSNQRALFRGTNNRIKRPDADRRGRPARLGISGDDGGRPRRLNQKDARQICISRDVNGDIYEAVSRQESLPFADDTSSHRSSFAVRVSTMRATFTRFALCPRRESARSLALPFGA